MTIPSRPLVRSIVTAMWLMNAAACAKHDIRLTSVPPTPATPPATREVVLVGNNWDGTVTAFSPKPPYEVLGTFGVVPDKAFLDDETDRSLTRSLDMSLIRGLAGEGHDQLVDDIFSSSDGRYLFASRPSYRDVVAIDLTDPGNPQPHWRTRVKGTRADHAAISRDGQTLLVSASTARRVHVIDTATGKIETSFASGDEPHESNYTHDGKTIFHASIGRVFLPTTSTLADPLKGNRWFEIVDAETFKVRERYDMRERTKAFGQEWKDAAVRPMAISSDDQKVYFQMSFLHGYYVFDVGKKQVVDMKKLPGFEEVERLRPSEFQLNSADHGITISGDDKKLCVAGTITGMAYIVDIDPFRVTTIDLHDPQHPEIPPKPYWSTTSADGKDCYISISGLNQVVVIPFADAAIRGVVRVGFHPQRVRNGHILTAALASRAQP